MGLIIKNCKSSEELGQKAKNVKPQPTLIHKTMRTYFVVHGCATGSVEPAFGTHGTNFAYSPLLTVKVANERDWICKSQWKALSEIVTRFSILLAKEGWRKSIRRAISSLTDWLPSKSCTVFSHGILDSKPVLSGRQRLAHGSVTPTSLRFLIMARKKTKRFITLSWSISMGHRSPSI